MNKQIQPKSTSVYIPTHITVISKKTGLPMIVRNPNRIKGSGRSKFLPLSAKLQFEHAMSVQRNQMFLLSQGLKPNNDNSKINKGRKTRKLGYQVIPILNKDKTKILKYKYIFNATL